MNIIGKIIDVEDKNIKGKPVAQVSIKAGNDLFSVMLWNNEVKKNTHLQARKMINQDIVVEVSPELYNGRLQYQFGYEPTFIPVVDYLKQHAQQIKAA